MLFPDNGYFFLKKIKAGFLPALPVETGRYLQSFYLFQDRIRLADSLSALFEQGFFIGIQVQFEHFLDAVFTQYDGYADADILLAVFAFEVSAARNDFFLVADDRLDHTMRKYPAVWSA